MQCRTQCPLGNRVRSTDPRHIAAALCSGEAIYHDSPKYAPSTGFSASLLEAYLWRFANLVATRRITLRSLASATARSASTALAAIRGETLIS